MRKILPLLLAIAVGLGGFLYFKPDVLVNSKIENIFIYTSEEYKSKKPSPFIKLEKANPINIVVETINSSHNIKRKVDVTASNYTLDLVDSDKKMQTFFLWINENTTSAMYQNKNSDNFYIVSKEDTNKLKTLIFR